MLRWLGPLIVAHAVTAHAESTVTVTLNAEGEALAQRLGLSVPTMIENARAGIDELFRLSQLPGLLQSFADTAAMTQTGLGIDYDPDPGDFLIGATAGGIHGDVAIGTDNDLLGGSVINFAVMSGVNLGRWRHPRWTVFASGFYESTTIHDLDGSLFTLGGHVQYRAIPASRPGNVRWTGVLATTGLEYTSWTVGTTTNGSVESNFTARGTNENKTIHMSSTGVLDVDTTTVRVPIEVTTGVRFLDTFVLYGGGGLDLTAGSSTIAVQLDSVLSINADHLPIGNAVLGASESDSPDAFSVHGIVGVGIHSRHVRVAFQGVFAPGETAVSIAFRIAP